MEKVNDAKEALLTAKNIKSIICPKWRLHKKVKVS